MRASPAPPPGTVQYSTVQYSTVQYSTVQYSTVQPSTTTRLRCSACECGIVRWTESPHERIVNGAAAPAHAYPWQIALFYPNYSREFWTRLLAFLEASHYPG